MLFYLLFPLFILTFIKNGMGISKNIMIFDCFIIFQVTAFVVGEETGLAFISIHYCKR